MPGRWIVLHEILNFTIKFHHHNRIPTTDLVIPAHTLVKVRNPVLIIFNG